MMRYFIGYDSSGHQYVVPLEKEEDWFEWLSYPDDNPQSWDEPGYATRVDGRLTFTDPVCM